MVHRFIVRETIEERILAAVAASGVEKWSDECVTLQQMFDLFSGQEEMSLEISLMKQSSPETTSVRPTARTRYSDDSDSDQERSTRVTFGEGSVSTQENVSTPSRPELVTFGDDSDSDQDDSSIQEESHPSSFVENFRGTSSLINGQPALVTFPDESEYEEE